MFYDGPHNQFQGMPERRQMRFGAFDPVARGGGIVPPHMRQAGGLPPMQVPPMQLPHQMHTGGPGQMFQVPGYGISRPGGMQPSPNMGPMRQAGGGQMFPQSWNALARMYFGG